MSATPQIPPRGTDEWKAWAEQILTKNDNDIVRLWSHVQPQPGGLGTPPNDPSFDPQDTT